MTLFSASALTMRHAAELTIPPLPEGDATAQHVFVPGDLDL